MTAPAYHSIYKSSDYGEESVHSLMFPRPCIDSTQCESGQSCDTCMNECFPDPDLGVVDARSHQSRQEERRAAPKKHKKHHKQHSKTTGGALQMAQMSAPPAVSSKKSAKSGRDWMIFAAIALAAILLFLCFHGK